VAGAVLSGLGFTDSELSILIVDDEEMARLNGQYRQMNTPTDVLAFPLLEGDFGNILPELLGDVVISVETAQVMSHLHHRPLPAILDLLLVHGILHLVGYDHERDPDEARRMEERSLELLKMLGHAEESFGWYMKGRGE
jgi:probable rRNA maturation factor